MSDLVQGPIGPEGDYDVSIVKGKIIAKAKYAGAQLGANLELNLDLIALLEKLKVAIPGSIDDAVISFVEAAVAAQE